MAKKRALGMAKAATLALAIGGSSCASEEEICREARANGEATTQVFDATGSFVSCCWPGDHATRRECCEARGGQWSGVACGNYVMVGPFVPPALV